MSFCVSNLPFSLGTFQGRLRQVSLHGREWRMHLKALNLKVRGYNQRHKNGDETSEFFSCAGTWTHGVWKSFWWTLDTLLNSQPTPPPANGAFVHPLGAIKLPPTWEDKHLPEHWPLSGTISFQEMGRLKWKMKHGKMGEQNPLFTVSLSFHRVFLLHED